MVEKLKKIWGGFTTAIVAVAVAMALLLVGARLIGLQVFTVLSGSMEPNYHVGSIIYVKKVDPATLKEGDAISFLLSKDTVATHRIVEVIPDENNPHVIRFRTKGDNNDIVDTNLVHCENVLGKVVGTIPLLGYVSDFVQHPPGTYIAIGGLAILVLAVFVPDIVTNAKALKEENQPEETVEQTAMETEKLKAELEALKQKIQQQTQEEPQPENKNDEEN